MKQEKFTIEDLRNGKVAVENDGTLEELKEVLKLAQPNTHSVYFAGNSKYYWMHNDYFWNNRDELPVLPVVSVKDFLPVKSQYPKVMWVSGDKNFNNKAKRVVFMEKNGKYIAWRGAETLLESEKEHNTTSWQFAKDIEPETVELTMNEIAEKFGVDVKSLKIKK